MITGKAWMHGFVAWCFLAVAPGVQAAPQILGLMATKVPQPLMCRGAECTAELVSYCLQPNRPEPWPGHAYEPSLGADLTLVGRTADGRVVRVEAEPYVHFSANVAMTTVRVSIDQALLAELGVEALSLDVGRSVSLLPVVYPDDANPLSKEEIAEATGTARAIGADFFENGPVGDTARLTAALLSRLPRNDRISPEERERLWDDAVGSDLEAASSSEGLEQARAAYEQCLEAVGNRVYYSIRDCIEGRHGRVVRKQNQALGKTLKTGW